MVRTAIITAFVALFFAGKSRGEDGPSILPAKHKAFSIRVDPSDDAIQSTVPGSRVNLLVVRKLDGGKVETKVLLDNLLVVAVDEIPEKPDGAKYTIKTFTLAIAEKDVPALLTARKTGELKVVLPLPTDAKPPPKKD